MKSRTIYIFCKRKDMVDKTTLIRVSIGGFIGALFCIFWLQGVFQAKQLKVFFVSLFLAFALVTTYFKQNNSRLSIQEEGSNWQTIDKHFLLLPLVGFIGGVVSNWIGNGIDIISYIVLVLFYRLDIRIATTTSIVLMAIQSVASTLCFFAMGSIPAPVIGMWMSAIPIVIFGAPLGAFFVTKVPKKLIANFLNVVILLQFIAVYVVLEFTNSLYALSVGTIVVAIFLFSMMNAISPYKEREATSLA